MQEDKQEIEPPKHNRISLDIIKDIPKYSRIKTNREECYYKRKNEEDYNEIIKDFLYISSYNYKFPSEYCLAAYHKFDRFSCSIFPYFFNQWVL